ncbi:MAG: GH92 family glycosyl hydrolase [Prevotellaceae bacterium]|nr:GH92 family glycosyl hydrolase [Prevotellaceae bacterium]
MAACTGVASRGRLLPYVDTRTGTSSSVHTAGLFGQASEEFGQTLPAVLEPYGMNFWTPQTSDGEAKCVAPYYYADTLLQGFRNSHWIVGGCTQDYGSMTLMPLFGQLRCRPEERAVPFSHDSEEATPAYYAVSLPSESLQAEMTATSRAAIFRFTYAKEGTGYLTVNPNSDEGEGSVEIDPVAGRVWGENPVHRIYQGWGEPAGFSGHFLIDFPKTITGYGVFRGDTVYADSTRISGGKGIGAYLAFDVKAGEAVLAKASSSFVDMAGAGANMEAEIPHWDFDRVRAALTDTWERRLSLIEVESPDRDAKALFYGALYRASFLPHAVNDADGRYPAFSAGTPIERLPQGETYYDDYSLWDTFRALHPLVTLLTPELSGQMMQSLLYKYEQGGWMPIFPCWNSYTSEMIGDHAAAVMGDAYCKGVRNFDLEKAYEALRKNAFETPGDYETYRQGKGRRALVAYLKYGYIPLEDSVPDAFHTNEQVSRTMEYAYDDFVLARLAAALGKTGDEAVLMRRAANYRNVINPGTGYVQGRRADGSFLDGDNAFGLASFITEGAPCHYTWFAPHDVYGLMACMGGKERFVAKLDSMFSEGRYWHGNEPCHQVAFMFNYAGRPWMTQRAVRHILDTEYHNAPGGLPGNDDAGQMSAWYLFAAMGFYPVCPGTPCYLIASPTFPKLTLHPEGGRPFTVEAEGVSRENRYIQSATFNGLPFTRNYLTHEEILQGGLLHFVMGPEPNEAWGSADGDCPPDLMGTVAVEGDK